MIKNVLTGKHILSTQPAKTRGQAEKTPARVSAKVTSTAKRALLSAEHARGAIRDFCSHGTVRVLAGNPGAVFRKVMGRARSTKPASTQLAIQAGSKTSAAPIESRKEQFTPEMLKAAIGQIGQYSVPDATPAGAQAPTGLGALDEAAKEILHAGCNPIGSPPTARKEFMEGLQKRFTELTENPMLSSAAKGESTSMKQLLGKDLLILYKEALKEECKDSSFRDAVFNESAGEPMKDSPCPGKKLVMYIGGPSASGKSFARGHFIEKLKEKFSSGGAAPKSEGENFVVSVDGGVERELCQMRNLVLQVSNNLGHTDIKDLHKHTTTGIKSIVHDTAMKGGQNMHLVIPATFIAEIKDLVPLMKKLAKEPDIQIGSEYYVIGASAQPESCRLSET